MARQPKPKIVLQKLSKICELALELAIEKLLWALSNTEEAAKDPLVKLAMSKGLDHRLPDNTVSGSRVEVVLRAPELKSPSNENEPQSEPAVQDDRRTPPDA